LKNSKKYQRSLMEIWLVWHLIGKQNILLMKKSIWILALLLSVAFVPRQSRVLKGIVTSATDGKAMLGVTVTLKGTQITATTDVAGEFTIRIPDSKGSLIFSFVGYKTKEVQIGTSMKLDVKMEEDVTKDVDEMVVAPQVAQKLQGRVAGVQIRGYSSRRDAKSSGSHFSPMEEYEHQPQWNTEEYDAIEENISAKH
jgi:Ca-activated chloride channel family protein